MAGCLLARALSQGIFVGWTLMGSSGGGLAVAGEGRRSVGRVVEESRAAVVGMAMVVGMVVVVGMAMAVGMAVVFGMAMAAGMAVVVSMAAAGVTAGGMAVGGMAVVAGMDGTRNHGGKGSEV